MAGNQQNAAISKRTETYVTTARRAGQTGKRVDTHTPSSQPGAKRPISSTDRRPWSRLGLLLDSLRLPASSRATLCLLDRACSSKPHSRESQPRLRRRRDSAATTGRKKMPTLRRRKAKEQDKENTDAMVDDDDDEQEFDDGDHESDADFEGSPAKKPKDDEELPQAPPIVDGGAAPQAPIDGGAARCGANVDMGDGCGVLQEACNGAEGHPALRSFGGESNRRGRGGSRSLPTPSRSSWRMPWMRALPP